MKAAQEALEALGGSLESYYFAFGDTDVFLVVDLPDNVIATAVSPISNAAGGFKTKTTVLITHEEVDKATEVAKEMSSAYRPPVQ